MRYDFFKKKNVNSPVIVAHHLDDAVETWVWSSLHGQSKLIPYRHGNVIRPFLATPKKELVKWAENHFVPWIDDYTNMDTRHQRNFIRHMMMPQVLRVNPGIHKTIRKKLLARGVDKIA
jgi:tRNA(Ile)-lysidine synthase